MGWYLSYFLFLLSEGQIGIGCEWARCWLDGGPQMGHVKDMRVILVFQLFVMVQGLDLVFSIIHLSPLVSNSLFTFTVSTMFLSDGY